MKERKHVLSSEQLSLVNEHVLFSQTAWVGILIPTLNKCNMSKLFNLLLLQVLFSKKKIVKPVGF